MNKPNLSLAPNYKWTLYGNVDYPVYERPWSEMSVLWLSYICLYVYICIFCIYVFSGQLFET